jgi:uncharacterized protein
VIVADTGAMVALLDASEEHHAAVRRIYQQYAHEWVVPSAILAEVDYLVAKYLGPRAQDLFLADLAEGAFTVDWGRDEDLGVARRIARKYRTLRLGLVDALVIAAAERLKSAAIVTLDLRHFGAVTIKGDPKLLPRDG